eukprot:4421027-Amphidinium_carterae.1
MAIQKQVTYCKKVPMGVEEYPPETQTRSKLCEVLDRFNLHTGWLPSSTLRITKTSWHCPSSATRWEWNAGANEGWTVFYKDFTWGHHASQ